MGDTSSVDYKLYCHNMATTDLIQPTNLTKYSRHQNHCARMDTSKPHDKITIASNNISKQEPISPKKKYVLNESESIRQMRIRSLSHWSHITPSAELMAASGWFSCNVNDRVICIYCNTICHVWTMNDNPAEVHARLAPQCPFVLSMSSTEQTPKIVNENFNQKFEPHNPKMGEISGRQETFAKTTWPENSPSIDDLVRAGFFFSGIENTVTCFYCNGSLHKWGANDNPMVEHARWFPHCTYAKHLCGNQLYGKILISKKQLLMENKMSKEELTRAVAARLDLPVVERLRSQYQLAVIKRCIEDQLRIKNDDFASDIDWTMACLILQKQIDHIKGSQDNIIIPSGNQQPETSSESKKPSLGECLICLTEEKQLACMPCGHLCACVPCGYALRSCPICRETIQSFMRINS